MPTASLRLQPQGRRVWFDEARKLFGCPEQPTLAGDCGFVNSRSAVGLPSGGNVLPFFRRSARRRIAPPRTPLAAPQKLMLLSTSVEIRQSKTASRPTIRRSRICAFYTASTQSGCKIRIIFRRRAVARENRGNSTCNLKSALETAASLIDINDEKKHRRATTARHD